jgi:hypothetical protein
MKHRLGRGATFAAAAVAVSLFVMLCMAFYGKDDYLAPERVLARGDALRFRIASLLVEPFGAGAFLGLGLLFVWSVIAFFREGVGPVVPRLVGVAACIPAFCAITSLASSAGPHEFWAGSVGVWMGDVVYRGFGPVMAWAVVGTLFLVSFAMATEMGFYGHLATLRGRLSFPLLPPEEPAAEESFSASSATAVLEPPTEGAVELAGAPGVEYEPWKMPEPWVLPETEPEDVELADAPATAPPPVEPSPIEEALFEDPDTFSDAVVLDREAHIMDIRRRMAAGEAVTDVEKALVVEDRDRAAVADAVDALFDDPVIFEEPAARDTGAPAALAEVPELPPFLLPDSTPPLLSQELAMDAPTFPPAGPAPLSVPAPVEAPAAPTPAQRAEAGETADLGEPVSPILSTRAPYIFSAVEFLPPNEELADANAAAAAAPEAPAESVEAETPAAPEAPAIDPVAHMAAFSGSVLGEPAPVVTSPALPVLPSAAATPASVESSVFEDEIFSFGLDSSDAAASAAATVEAPAPVVAPEPVAEASAPVVDVVPEPVVEPSPAPTALPEEFAGEVAAVAPVESMPEPVVESAPEPVVDAEPATPAPDEVLAKLFGEPVVRPTFSPAPTGPAQSEPREPPANLSPVIEEVEERVTLLSDPPITDCLSDHGIELNQQAVLPPSDVVVEDASVPTAAPALTNEAAADAIVASFQELWGESVEEPAAEASPAPDATEEEAGVHGWGTMYPFMLEEAVAADPDDAEAGILITRQDETEDRAPAHGPPPSQMPADPVEPRAEAVVEDSGPAAAPAAVPTIPEVAPVLPVILDDPILEEPAEEEAKVDEALVASLVEGFRSEDAPAAVESPAEPEIVPAVVPPVVEPTGDAGPDEYYDQAVAAVRERGRGSVVVLQRKLGIGFTRATRLLERLVAEGVLGPENASGSHPVL